MINLQQVTNKIKICHNIFKTFKHKEIWAKFINHYKEKSAMHYCSVRVCMRYCLLVPLTFILFYSLSNNKIGLNLDDKLRLLYNGRPNVRQQRATNATGLSEKYTQQLQKLAKDTCGDDVNETKNHSHFGLDKLSMDIFSYL